MARRSGHKGVVYCGVADDTAAAQKITGVSKWSIEFATDKEEVTAMGDANKQKVATLADVSGDFEGFWDDAAESLLNAALDGKARKMYIYPSTDVSTKYWHGTAFLSTSYEGGVEDPISYSVEFEAAGDWKGVGV